MAMHLGKRLKDLMKLKGHSNREVSQWLDLTDYAVTKIYSREHLSTEILFTISEHSGIPIEVFMRASDSVQDSEQEAIALKTPVLKRTLSDCEVEVARLSERLASMERLLIEKDSRLNENALRLVDKDRLIELLEKK